MFIDKIDSIYHQPVAYSFEISQRGIPPSCTKRFAKTPLLPELVDGTAQFLHN